MRERIPCIGWLVVGDMELLNRCNKCAVCAGHPYVTKINTTWQAPTAQEAADGLLRWYKEAFRAIRWVTTPHIEIYDPEKGYTLSAAAYKSAGAGYTWNHDVDRIDRNGPYGR
jgi:hypothetical protein